MFITKINFCDHTFDGLMDQKKWILGQLENDVQVFGLALDRADMAHPKFSQIECDLSDMDALASAFGLICSTS